MPSSHFRTISTIQIYYLYYLYNGTRLSEQETLLAGARTDNIPHLRPREDFIMHLRRDLLWS